MKKHSDSFTYRCAKCNRLSVDIGLGERSENKCAYCYGEDQILSQYKKKVINAGARDEAIKSLKEAYHRP